MDKRDARTLSPNQLDELRDRAIALWKKGYNRRKIAALLDVHYNSVGRWVAIYQIEGTGALRSAKRGRKKGTLRNLTEKQEKMIQRLIIDKTPDQLKMPFALWTRRAVCDLVEERCGLRLPERTCGEYLKRWGFTPQRPARRHYEQNSAAVQQWIKVEYPALVRRAKEEGSEIHWGDETGVRNEGQHGRGFAPVGKTPVVKISSKRFSLNMISSITNQGKVRWMIYRDGFNAAIFIRFLSRLIKDAQRKVILVVDNLRVHHCKVVKQWVARHSKKIELAYLPSYSPEHNPDEYLNGDLKSSLSRKRSPRTQAEMEGNVKSHMRMLSKNPARVASLFEAAPVRYAAAA